MKTEDRTLPKNIYPSGKRYIAVVRYNGKRTHLGSFGTIEAAQERVDLFNEHNPPRRKRDSYGSWKPGDVL